MDLADLDRRIRRLEDLEAIKQLKARYAALCDANYDADGLAALFTADAVWDGGQLGKSEGREAIRQFFPRIQPPHLVRDPQHPEPHHRGRRGHRHGELVSVPGVHLHRWQPSGVGSGDVSRPVRPGRRHVEVPARANRVALLDAVRGRLGANSIHQAAALNRARDLQRAGSPAARWHGASRRGRLKAGRADAALDQMSISGRTVRPEVSGDLRPTPRCRTAERDPMWCGRRIGGREGGSE